MPKQIKSSTVPYDMEAWRKRVDLTQEQAAKMLGISRSKIWRAERDKQASMELQWACYGLERHLYDQRTGRLPPT